MGASRLSGLRIGSAQSRYLRKPVDFNEFMNAVKQLEVYWMEEHRGRKRAEELLEDAIENMADGFALFDAEDRFVLCNENYRNILSGIADHLVPGTSFEDMTRAFAERGLIAVEADHIDDWFRTRVAQHRAAEGFHEHQFSDGRWIRSAERRTSDGGLVCIRTDITELKRAEAQIEHLALHDGLTDLSRPFASICRNWEYLLTTKKGKNLTKRQAQVLQKLASGHANKAIAEHLGISVHTVRLHVSAILRALDVSNRTQAALIARDLLR